MFQFVRNLKESLTMYLEKCYKTGSNKLFKNVANSWYCNIIIDKIGLRGTSFLCNLGKPITEVL